jgi:ubiquinone/menaquinone biosynthesis C-methylase UbiE
MSSPLPAILAGMTRTSRSETLDRIGTDLIYRIGSTSLYKKAFKYFYPLMTRRLVGKEDVVFLNWGYEEDPPMGLPLDETDEPNRYSIQLYHQTAAQVDISAKDVLEVSCGHGGGASYLGRTLHPASYTALDFNASGIAFYKKRHNLPGLEFVQGDAQNLPFPDASFDAVINVEASHIYPDFERFLSEVARVLRPGGDFLYTDFRNRDAFTDWEAALTKPPLRLVSKKVIDKEVLRGLEKNSPRSMEIINRYLPAFARRFGREFAVVDGSLFFKDLERGEISYRTYHLTKE